ncbi:MAG: VC0807 family protein [Porticoccaceae bacterium]
MTATTVPTPPRESLLLNLGLNIVAPSLVLMKLSGPDALGTTWGLIVALAFPVGYGVWDFFRRRKFNLFSIIGVISVSLTGGISLLALPPHYLALKEAAVPGLLGIGIVLSLKTRWPLVRSLLLNDAVLDTARIHTELTTRGEVASFERALVRASWIVASSFFLSSALNYALATAVVTASAGSLEYNEQLGQLTALSYPVIALPATLVMMGALFYLFRCITRLTGLTFEDLLRTQSGPAQR